MAPRRYSMGKREDAVADTRRRIVEAAVALHRERGIAGTTMQDIAEAADVSPGTVYRHFPNVESVIPACGARIGEITAPPAPSMLDGVAPKDRVGVLVRELYAYYERGAPWIDDGYTERGRFQVLDEIMASFDAMKAVLVEAALGDAAPATRKVAAALTHFYAWKAMTAAGMTTDEAADVAVRAIALEEKGGALSGLHR